MMIYRCITWMASRRRSFAGCFSRRIDDCSGLAGSAVGFNPFKYYIKKGPEAHRGRGLASRPFKPSAETDGKREVEGALGIADTDTYIRGGIGNPKRKRSFLRKA